ncbi:Rha family transcriptional regulator [Tabrizicola oligotrophica]|uniref:Rha family transcriptional regulator n=1 Tax=Tabrizicola oligotrophica TaxID=2710650 RepID=A0A6M0QQK8_9RHOB|nr:Rha family transcriptional regulator [Tabrizicola oligotrophica]NEY88672.1 Rha family transcriptional regulator [Tabrizicola oligotrophica]
MTNITNYLPNSADTSLLPVPIPETIPARCRNVPFMSSLELADMTGKRHDHVLRDIERELEKIGEALPKFGASYRDRSGKVSPCYVLPGTYLLFIASAYDAKLRFQIIRHWEALNNGTAQSVKDAANLYAKKLIEGSRAERHARIAAETARFVEMNDRLPNAAERFLLGKP